ncbi:putative Gnk2-like domain-containing protein [Dioscorea sansibarensis]
MALLNSVSVSLLLLLMFSRTLSDPLYQHCETTGNYTTNSPYESNLSELLTFLSAKGSIQGFSKKSIGNTPNQVYGMVLCRGDINTTECRSCLNLAAQEVVQLCPFSKGATIWNYHCVLRHSNQYFLSSSNDSDVFYVRSNEHVTEQGPFNKTVIEMMDAVFRWAAYNTSRKFATGEAYFNQEFHKIYGLGQCTPDLSGDQCLQCLRGTCKMTRNMIAGRQLGNILGIRCNVRYSTNPFFNGRPAVLYANSQSPPGTLVPTPAASPTSASLPGKKGKDSNCFVLFMFLSFPTE